MSTHDATNLFATLRHTMCPRHMTPDRATDMVRD